jgi:hypothetical protein
MSKLKKWQCPRCPQDSNRRWNIVVHIGRKHGSGDPGEKRDSDQAGRPVSFHLDKTNKNREYSQSYPNNNRYNLGYKTTGRGNDAFGDMVDYMYRFLTYFEENVHKTGEIKRIADRHNSSKTPQWVPLMKYNPHAFANAFQAWLSEVMKNYQSSKQRDSDTTAAASSNQEIKKTSLDLSSSVEKANTHQSSSSVDPVSSENTVESMLKKAKENDWKEEDGWMVKRDMYGNVRDVYKLRETFDFS